MKSIIVPVNNFPISFSMKDLSGIFIVNLNKFFMILAIKTFGSNLEKNCTKKKQYWVSKIH